MKLDNLGTLKELALRGAVKGQVALSSRELARAMGVSQQSASKKILELLDAGLIERNLGARKQLIRITPSGADALRQEYSDYRVIFERLREVCLAGTVESGLGEGKYYVTHEGYASQFQRTFGFTPYEGTLNVKVRRSDVNKLALLRQAQGLAFSGFEAGGRKFGGVKGFRCELAGRSCGLIMPKRTHYDDVVEVISSVFLRGELGIKDGDDITLNVVLEGE